MTVPSSRMACSLELVLVFDSVLHLLRHDLSMVPGLAPGRNVGATASPAPETGSMPSELGSSPLLSHRARDGDGDQVASALTGRRVSDRSPLARRPDWPCPGVGRGNSGAATDRLASSC